MSSLAVVVLAAIGLVGCTGSRPGMVGEDPRIIVHDFEGGMDGLIIGTLRYDPDSRCLFLEHDDGSLSAPLWPNGSTPIHQDGERGVDVAGYGRILEGDAVAAGGGGTTLQQVADLNIAEDCVPDVEFGSSGLAVITYID
jgi:hypothetical protein